MHALHEDIRPFEVCSIRPPTENCSLTFRLTRNCYWNKCSIERALGRGGETSDEALHADLDPRLAWFLPWFKEMPGIRDSFMHVMSWRMGGAKTCFLGDTDSLILEPAFLAEVIRSVRESFPTIEHFTVYGRTRSAARLRTPGELQAYRAAGLDRVHFGLESGCDEVLAFMNKGVTKAWHVEVLSKTKDAGISCSVCVMPGLGGKTFSDRHAHDTAEVITKAAPDFVRLRSLQIFPGTPLEEAARKGRFMEADEEDLVREIRTMVEEIACVTEIMSDSASNLLDISGRLPKEREAMLKEIDAYLSLTPAQRLLLSLPSRISSFVGQYGGLTRDIHAALTPFIEDGRLDEGGCPGSGHQGRYRSHPLQAYAIGGPIHHGWQD